MSLKLKALDQNQAIEMGKSCVCFITRKAARCITQFYDEMLRPVDLRSTQLILLNSIRILGPVSIKRLAKAVVMDRSALARNLKPLDKQGLIRIERGDDLRERVVTLTELGHEKATEAFPLWERAQAEVQNKLGHEGLDTLFASLSGVVSLTRKK
jgi:DNA-binding MarR family transcriptional regulator